MPADTFAKDHHAGTVTGRVERKVQGQDTARKRVGQEGNPRSPQNSPRLGADRPDIRLRVIDVSDLEGPVSMARRALVQLPIERLKGISGPVATPFLGLLSASATVDREGERLVARSRHLAFGRRRASAPTMSRTWFSASAIHSPYQ